MTVTFERDDLYNREDALRVFLVMFGIVIGQLSLRVSSRAVLEFGK